MLCLLLGLRCLDVAGFHHAALPEVPLAESADELAASDPLVAAALNRTVRQMQKLGSIPRILHITVKKKFDLSTEQPLIKHGVGAFMRLNPSWELRIHEDADIISLLKRKLPTDDWKLLSSRHIVELSDLWRMVVVYYEGGLYMDIDRLSNRNIDFVARGALKMLLPVGADFSQDVVCSAPHNPVLRTAIELNTARRRICSQSKKAGNPTDQPPRWAPSHVPAGKLCGIYNLGPITYLNALSAHLLGKQLNRDAIRLAKTNGSPLWEAALARLKVLRPYVRVYREHLPFDSMLFSEPGALDPPMVLYNESTADKKWQTRVAAGIAAAKRAFYREQGSKYWSGRL
eukprot:5734679-Prymnesium_polylepis.1